MARLLASTTRRWLLGGVFVLVGCESPATFSTVNVRASLGALRNLEERIESMDGRVVANAATAVAPYVQAILTTAGPNSGLRAQLPPFFWLPDDPGIDALVCTERACQLDYMWPLVPGRSGSHGSVSWTGDVLVIDLEYGYLDEHADGTSGRVSAALTDRNSVFDGRIQIAAQESVDAELQGTATSTVTADYQSIGFDSPCLTDGSISIRHEYAATGDWDEDFDLQTSTFVSDLTCIR